jgi:hypothetical protein
MTTSNIFLPFWKFMAAVFVWYLFLECLEKLGLAPAKSKSK